ncbi:MAG: hypothetical protein LUC25_07410 [Ruminococcus sp.]|nr:hypothetical protein [Ruminococcus sp.]
MKKLNLTVKKKKVIIYVCVMLLFLMLCTTFVFLDTSSISAFVFFATLGVGLLFAMFFKNRAVKALPPPTISIKNDRVVITQPDVREKQIYTIYYDDIRSSYIDKKLNLIIVFWSGSKSKAEKVKDGIKTEIATHSCVVSLKDTDLAEKIIEKKETDLPVVVSKKAKKRYYKAKIKEK